MARPNSTLGIMIFASGVLTVLIGFVGAVLPHAAADVLVELVRKSALNDNDVYTMVAERLSNGMLFYFSIVTILGFVVSTCSWIVFFKNDGITK
jgi:hypothetical protein